MYAHFTHADIPFYVGKGTGKRCASFKTRSAFWKSVSKNGWYFSILFRGTEQDCLDLELRIVKKIGRRDLSTGPLVNLTSGGDGMRSPSEDVRLKMSAAKKGKPMSLKDRIIRSGWKHTETTKLQMSKQRSGKQKSLDHVDKMRSRTVSAETRKKIKDATQGVKNHSAKAIILIHLDGTEEFFGCGTDAALKYNLRQAGISKCCRGVQLSHHGFKIKFAPL